MFEFTVLNCRTNQRIDVSAANEDAALFGAVSAFKWNAKYLIVGPADLMPLFVA